MTTGRHARKGSGATVAHPNKPGPAALDFLRERGLFWELPDGAGWIKLLVHWRQNWMAWEAGVWVERSVDAIKSDLWLFFGEAFWVAAGGERVEWNPNTARITNVLAALQAEVHLDDEIEVPGWYPDAEELPGTLLPVRNGILDMDSRTLLPHTPLLMNQAQCPVVYDAAAPAPTRFLALLAEMFPGDPDSVALVQEMYGWALSGDTTFQKIFMVIGPKRSSKGTVGEVLRRLVGEKNAVAPTLGSLGGDFGLAQLLGKTLAIIGDARDSAGFNTSTVVERLLTISGGDAVTVDRKYKQPVTVRLGVRFIFLSNQPPRFGDASAAINDRQVWLRTEVSHLGREDRGLLRRLLPELPGILLWALDGWDRLQSRGRFTVPDSVADLAETARDLSSPVAKFLRERFEFEPSATVSKSEAYRVWQSWCFDNGATPTQAVVFHRDFGGALAGELGMSRGKVDFRPRVDGKPGPRLYRGVRLLLVGDPRLVDGLPGWATP